MVKSSVKKSKAEKGNGIKGELLQFVRLGLTKKWHLNNDRKSVWVSHMDIWGKVS